jgi:ribonuclease E
MSKEICISTTPHETRLAILENDELTEIYYERENEYTLAGSIYKGKVTRVLPGMQSAFVDVGLERDAFLYVTDFLEEQEDGADFDRAGTGGQQPRRESGRDGGREGSRSRPPQVEAPVEASPEAQNGEESGAVEGESAAGTRRWRGRRGRRRGVRPGESTPQENGDARAAEPVDSAESDTPVFEQHQPDLDSGPHAMPRDSSERPRAERSRPEHPRPENPRSDHHRSERQQSEHRAPAAGPGRIVLPGESLSKYGGASSAAAGAPVAAEDRQAGTAAASFRPNYTPPKPSTLLSQPIVWDGGLLLPGESRATNRAQTLPVAKAETEHAGPEQAVPEHAVTGHTQTRTQPLLSSRKAKPATSPRRTAMRRLPSPSRSLPPSR